MPRRHGASTQRDYEIIVLVGDFQIEILKIAFKPAEAAIWPSFRVNVHQSLAD
jgi:hypothetical protein